MRRAAMLQSVRTRRFLASALVVGLVAAIAGAATWSAFSATTANSGNTFESGTVTISDNDGNATLMSLSNALPGATATGCIRVTYGGSLPAEVKLHGAVTGNLAHYLTLKVTRGTQTTGTYPNCGDFTADTRDYIGQGAGVLYNGNLSSYPGSWAAGIVDPDNATGSAATWTTNEVHTYRLEVTLQNVSAAQGQNASASFTWEARNQ